MWVLTVIGAIVVVLFIVRLTLLLGVRFVLKKAAKALSEGADGVVAKQMEDEIHLQVNPNANWEYELFRRDVLVLEAEGFKRVEAWTIPELGDIQVYGFVNHEKRCYSCIYNIRGSVINDFFCYLEGDTFNITASNAPNAGSLDPMPGREKVSCKYMSLEDTWEAFQNAIGGRALKTVSADELAPMFEYAYKSEMAWRKHKGLRPEEAERVAAEKGMDLLPGQAETVARVWNEANPPEQTLR